MDTNKLRKLVRLTAKLFLTPLIAMLIWNWQVVNIFGLPSLTYWQAFWIRMMVIYFSYYKDISD